MSTSCWERRHLVGMSARLEKYKRGKYDIILMDVNMPILNGIETTRLIRSENTEIPVIFLTANTVKSEIEKYFACGATDYLSKPFKTELLKEMIARYVY